MSGQEGEGGGEHAEERTHESVIVRMRVRVKVRLTPSTTTVNARLSGEHQSDVMT